MFVSCNSKLNKIVNIVININKQSVPDCVMEFKVTGVN